MERRREAGARSIHFVRAGRSATLELAVASAGTADPAQLFFESLRGDGNRAGEASAHGSLFPYESGGRREQS